MLERQHQPQQQPHRNQLSPSKDRPLSLPDSQLRDHAIRRDQGKPLGFSSHVITTAGPVTATGSPRHHTLSIAAHSAQRSPSPVPASQPLSAALRHHLHARQQSPQPPQQQQQQQGMHFADASVAAGAAGAVAGAGAGSVDIAVGPPGNEILPEAPQIAAAAAGQHGVHASGGKRAAARQLDTCTSLLEAAGNAEGHLVAKRQLRDHAPAGGDESLALQQPAAVAAPAAVPDTDEHMHDAEQPEQQQEQQAAEAEAAADRAHALQARSSLHSPFCMVLPEDEQDHAIAGSCDTQKHPAASAGGSDSTPVPRTGSSSGAPPAAGHMPPPRRLLPRAESSTGGSSSTAALAAGAGAGTAPSSGGGSGGSSPAQPDTVMAGEASEKVPELTSLEPSLSMNHILSRPSISSAASLEGWLPIGTEAAAAAAIAAAATAGNSPRAAAAAVAAASLIRSGSTVSTASIGRQASLVFGLPPRPSGGGLGAATLETSGSFAGWPGGSSGGQQGQQQQGQQQQGGGLSHEGSFSWPRVPAARSLSTDSLHLDIQVLAPVLPEEYPLPDPEADAAAAAAAATAAAAAAEAAAQQHTDRAFFKKVAAWEAELVGMLEQQSAPLAIRHIVAVFKDRINTERDKCEFKALCDKWTGVVEYPVGSGVKCLAIKSWMRGGGVGRQHHAQQQQEQEEPAE